MKKKFTILIAAAVAVILAGCDININIKPAKASFLGALNMERGIYEDSTRMYAPYYRQAAMKVYGLDRNEWEPYMQLAYSDVSAAFAWYLEHENNGRPIVLAGFSLKELITYTIISSSTEACRKMLRIV